MPHCFSPEETATVYRVIAERRDMRHFLPDPTIRPSSPTVIEAAHRAPSVGLTVRCVRRGDEGVDRLPRAEALGARAEGCDMGWVSMFDPAALARVLGIPRGGKPVAILCLGHVEAFYPTPMLETEGWTRPRPAGSCFRTLEADLG